MRDMRDMRDKTLELLMKANPVAPSMQDDPRYVFDQPEYYMGKELREFAKAKTAEWREKSKSSDSTQGTL